MERYNLIIQADLEVEQLQVALGPEDLSALEEALNQGLSGTDEVGEEAGVRLAQGLSQGAAEALNLRAALDKLRRQMHGEAVELAKEELAALKAAFAHLAQVSLDDGFRARAEGLVQGLARLSEAAERGQRLKLDFQVEGLDLSQVRAQAKAYAEAFRQELLAQLKALNLHGAPLAKAFPVNLVAELAAEAQIKGVPLSRLQTLREAIPTLRLEEGRLKADDPNLVQFLESLQRYTQVYRNDPKAQAEVKRRAVFQERDDWGTNHTRIRANLLKEAREGMAQAMGFSTKPSKTLLGTFGERALGMRVMPLPKAQELFDRALREVASEYPQLAAEGVLGPAAYLRAVQDQFAEHLRSLEVQAKSLAELKEKTADRQTRATLEQDLKELEAKRQELLALAQEVFEFPEPPKGPQDFYRARLRTDNPHVLFTPTGVAFLDKGVDRSAIPDLRMLNTLFTPVRAIREVREVELKDLGDDKAWGDGTIGRVRPAALGLPEGFEGLVQVRNLFSDPEAKVLHAVGKGTVLVSPKLERDEFNLSALYTKKPEQLQQAWREGRLKVTMGVVEVGHTSEAAFGKQAFLRHWPGGVPPLSAGRLNKEALQDLVRTATEGKMVFMAGVGDTSLAHPGAIAPLLASYYGEKGGQGVSTFIASHKAYKDLDPEVYDLLEKLGVGLDEEGNLIVPVVLGKEAAERLGARKGSVLTAGRNPIMGHRGSMVKVAVADVRENLQSAVFHDAGLFTMGADTDGDHVVLFPQGLPIKTYPLHQVRALMTLSGLDGGRKGAGAQEARLVHEDFVRALEADPKFFQAARKRLEALAEEADYLDLDDILATDNPWEVLRRLKASLRPEDVPKVLRPFERYLANRLARQSGKDAKEALEFLRLGYLIPGGDPRRQYTGLPYGRAAQQVAEWWKERFGFEAVKQEYANSFEIAAGNLGTQLLGLAENHAQRLESVLDLDRYGEIFDRLERGELDLKADTPDAEEARRLLSDPKLLEFGLQNFLYQVLTDRKKRNYVLRKGDEVYTNLTRMLYLSYHTDRRALPPDKVAGEEGAPSQVEQELLAALQALDLPGIREAAHTLFGPSQVARPPSLSELREANVSDTNPYIVQLYGLSGARKEEEYRLLNALLNVFYKGPYATEADVGSHPTLADLQAGMLRMRQAMEIGAWYIREGKAIGYESDPEKRRALENMLLPAAFSTAGEITAQMRQVAANVLAQTLAYEEKSLEFLQKNLGVRDQDQALRLAEALSRNLAAAPPSVKAAKEAARKALQEVGLDPDEKLARGTYRGRTRGGLFWDWLAKRDRDKENQISRNLIPYTLNKEGEPVFHHQDMLQSALEAVSFAKALRFGLDLAPLDEEGAQRLGLPSKDPKALLEEIAEEDIRHLAASLVDVKSSAFMNTKLGHMENALLLRERLLSLDEERQKRYSRILGAIFRSSDAISRALPGDTFAEVAAVRRVEAPKGVLARFHGKTLYEALAEKYRRGDFSGTPFYLYEPPKRAGQDTYAFSTPLPAGWGFLADEVKVERAHPRLGRATLRLLLPQGVEVRTGEFRLGKIRGHAEVLEEREGEDGTRQVALRLRNIPLRHSSLEQDLLAAVLPIQEVKDLEKAAQSLVATRVRLASRTAAAMNAQGKDPEELALKETARIAKAILEAGKTLEVQATALREEAERAVVKAEQIPLFPAAPEPPKRSERLEAWLKELEKEVRLDAKALEGLDAERAQALAQSLKAELDQALENKDLQALKRILVTSERARDRWNLPDLRRISGEAHRVLHLTLPHANFFEAQERVAQAEAQQAAVAKEAEAASKKEHLIGREAVSPVLDRNQLQALKGKFLQGIRAKTPDLKALESVLNELERLAKEVGDEAYLAFAQNARKRLEAAGQRLAAAPTKASPKQRLYELRRRYFSLLKEKEKDLDELEQVIVEMGKLAKEVKDQSTLNLARRAYRNLKSGKLDQAPGGGGSGGGRKPPKPPAPPSGGDDEGRWSPEFTEEVRGRVRRIRPKPLTQEDLEALGILRKKGDLDFAAYKGLVLSREEEAFLKTIYYNTQLYREGGQSFDRFALNYEELLLPFFGPIRQFSGRKPFMSEKNIARFAELLDAMAQAYGQGDLDEVYRLAEDLNVQAKAMDTAAKQLADLREFRRTGSLPFSRNLHTGSKDALFYRRMLAMGGKELERAIDEGDLETIQRIADQARHVEERIKLVQNAISNSLAFMFSSLVMNFFGQLQAQFMEMEQKARAVAALANMSGHRDIGQAIAQAAQSLGVGSLEVAEALKALDQMGLDPKEAAQVFAKLRGVLRATGEGMGELSALYAQLAQLGGLDPERAVKEVVGRGIYLSQAKALLEGLDLRREEVRDERTLGQILLALEGYQAKGIPVVLPKDPALRRERLSALAKEGAEREAELRREGRIPAQTDLGPSQFERLADQAKRTMEAVIQAAKPILTLFGGLLMLVLRVTEGVARLLSTPFGQVLVAAAGIYATLLAIMQVQKTLQVAEWAKSLLQGFRELNGELLSFLRGLREAARTRLQGLDLAPLVQIFDLLKGKAQAFFLQLKAQLADLFKGSWRQDLAGWLAGFLDGFRGPKGAPMGIVHPTFARLGRMGASRALGLAGAVAAMGVQVQDLSLAEHLAVAAGQALMLMPTPVTMGIGALLAFGAPAMGRSLRRMQAQNAADREMARLKDLAGDAYSLAEALTGKLSPALEKAGYTAETLRQAVEGAARNGTGGFRAMAEEALRLAERLERAEKVFSGLSDFVKTRYELYDEYFRAYPDGALAAMDARSLEAFERLFPGQLERVSAQGLMRQYLGLRVQEWAARFAELTANPLEKLFRQPGERLGYEVLQAEAQTRRDELETFRRLFQDQGRIRSPGGDNSLTARNLVQRFFFLERPDMGQGLAMGAGATVGALLGALAGMPLLGAGLVAGGALAGYLAFMQRRRELETRELIPVRVRAMDPVLRTALAGHLAVQDAFGLMEEEFRAAGIRREIRDEGSLLKLRGEQRVKAVAAMRKAYQTLGEIQESVVQDLTQRRYLDLLGLGGETLTGGGVVLPMGGADPRALRSRALELEARLSALKELPKVLEAQYAGLLRFERGADGSLTIGLEENSMQARQALAAVTQQLRTFGLEVSRLSEELRQVRFDELLRNMVAKGEQAFLQGLSQSGQVWQALLGLGLPKDPVSALAQTLSQLERSFTTADSKPAGIGDVSQIYGGPVTALPGQRGSLWRGSGGVHDGLDVALPKGAPVRWGEREGVVVDAGYHQAYGNYVAVYDPKADRTVLYAHLQEPARFKPGQKVDPKALLGRVGSTGNSTGPHLHVGLYQGAGWRGKAPILDPQAYYAYLTGLHRRDLAPVDNLAVLERVMKEDGFMRAWADTVGRMAARENLLEIRGQGEKLEAAIREREALLKRLMEDRSTREVIRKLAGLDLFGGDLKKAEAAIRGYAEAVLKLPQLRSQLQAELAGAKNRRAEERLLQGETQATGERYAPDAEARALRVELEAAKRERDLALRRAKTERDNALRNLEERRKTGRVSEQAYRVEREALEAAYAKSVAEAEGQYRTRTAQARLSDLERRLARRTAAIQNPREKVEVELKAYTDWLAAYAATAPKEITAAVRERIEDLKAQLRTLPDFSRLREAEVMEGLKSMFMGGRLPAFGLEILRLAESIRNDAQLTTVQKRRLGVNPEAMNLDQLLLPEGLLGRMHRLGVLGDAYAGTALPRLYAYQAVLAARALQGTAYAMEAPDRLLAFLEEKRGYYQADLLKNRRQELETLAKTLGLSLEDTAALLTERVFGQAIASVREMVQASRRANTELLRLLDSPLGLPTTTSRSYTQALEEAKQALERLKQTPGLDPAKVKEAEAKLRSLEGVAPRLDQAESRFLKLQRDLFLEGVTGNAQAEKLLEYVRSLNLPKDILSDFLQKLGLSEKALEAQLREGLAATQLEAMKDGFRLRQAQLTLQLLQQYGYRSNLPKERAQVLLDQERALMDLEGEYQAELARLDARVASMSTAELRAIVGEPWSSLGEEALRKRAKVVLKDRLDAWRRVQERVIRLSTEMAVDHLDRRMAQVQAELALEAERIQDSPLGLPTDQSFAYRQNLLQLKARVQEMEDSGLLDRGTLEGLKKALVDAEKQAQALDRLRTQWNRLQTSFLKESLTGEAQAEEVLAFVRQVKESLSEGTGKAFLQELGLSEKALEAQLRQGVRQELLSLDRQALGLRRAEMALALAGFGADRPLFRERERILREAELRKMEADLAYAEEMAALEERLPTLSADRMRAALQALGLSPSPTASREELAKAYRKAMEEQAAKLRDTVKKAVDEETRAAQEAGEREMAWTRKEGSLELLRLQDFRFGLAGEPSIAYRKGLLEALKGLETLERSGLFSPEETQGIRSKLESLKEPADLLDKLQKAFADFQIEMAQQALEGNRAAEASLEFLRKARPQLAGLPQELVAGFLQSLGLNEKALSRQLEEASEEARLELADYGLRVRSAQALVEVRRLPEGYEKELALAELEARQAEERADLELRRRLSLLDRSLAKISDKELKAALEEAKKLTPGQEYSREELEALYRDFYGELFRKEAEAEVAAARAASEQAMLEAARRYLTGRNYREMAKVLQDGAQLEKLKPYLSPEELGRATTLRAHAARLSDFQTLLEELAQGNRPQARPDLASLMSVPELRQALLDAILAGDSQLTEKVQSPYTSVQLEGYRELLARLGQLGLQGTPLWSEVQRQLLSRQLGLKDQDYRREMALLAQEAPTEGGLLAQEAFFRRQEERFQERLRSVLGEVPKDFTRLDALALERLERDKDLPEGTLRALQEEALELEKQRKNLELAQRAYRRYLEAERLLLEQRFLGYRLPGLTLAEQVGKVQDLKGRMEGALSRLAPGMGPEEILLLDDQALMARFQMDERGVQNLKALAEAIQGLDRELKELQVAERLEAFTRSLGRLEAALNRAEQVGSRKEVLKALEALKGATGQALKGILSNLGLSEEDLYLSEDELKSKGLDASKLPMVAKGRELLERLQALSLREGQLKAEIQLASLEERLEGVRKGRRDLSLYGTPQALREALAREVQATQEALDELLATLGLRPEDLFLSEDTLMEAKGVKREALPLVGQARQYLEALRSLKAEGIGDLVLLERPDTLEGFRQAVFRAVQALAPELTQGGLEAFWNALAEAAGDTPLGGLRQRLAEDPRLKELAGRLLLSMGEELGRLAAQGDLEAIRAKIQSFLPKELQGMDPLSAYAALRLTGMAGIDPLRQVQLSAAMEAYQAGLARRVQLAGEEIRLRYDSLAPLFGGPLSAARLEILKLQELYTAYQAQAQGASGSEAEALQEEANKVYEALLDAQRRFRYVMVREWNALLGSLLEAVKGSLGEGLKAALQHLFLNTQGQRLAEVDRKYRDEAGFAESELEEAKRQKALLEERLKAGGLSPEELAQTKALYEYYTQKVAELEDRVKRIRFEWEQARKEVESLAEVLGEILNRLADALMDRLANALVNWLWDAGLSLAAGMGGGAAPTGQAAQAYSGAGQGLAPQALPSQAASPQAAPSQAVGALSVAGGAAGDWRSLVGVGASGAAFGAKTGEDGNWLVSGLMGIGMATANATLPALLTGGLGAAGAAALGLLSNPMAWLAGLGAAAISAALASHARAEAFNRQHAGSATHGLYTGAEGLRKGAKLSVRVDVNAKMDPDEVAEESRKAIADALRKKEYSGGLTDI